MRERAVEQRVIAKSLKRRAPLSRAFRWGIGVLVLAAIVQEGAGVYYDRQMTAAAQSVTGRADIDVHCGRVWDVLLDFQGSAKPGFVYWDSTTANLQFPVCMDAAGWSDDPTDDDKRLALMILTHEVAHLEGHRNEAETECVAMWAAPRTAEALGGTAEQGRAAAGWYATTQNPRMPSEYRSRECLAGSPPASSMIR